MQCLSTIILSKDGVIVERSDVEERYGGIEFPGLAYETTFVLREAAMHRWGTPDGEHTPAREERFGCIAEEEGTFAGYTIPTRLRVGWFFGTERFAEDGEFFRCEIDHAEFR